MSDLENRERALVGVALAAASPKSEQLALAIAGGLSCGLTPDELAEACRMAGDPGSRFEQALASAGAESPAVPHMIGLSDHRTPVVSVGGGLPLVVVHSAGLDWRIARELSTYLRSKVRVIAYDIRAHGESTAAAQTFTLDACAADLIDLLDALGIESADVAGFSLGGAIAQLAALRAPTRIRSLVLACTMAAAKRDLYVARAQAAERHGSTATELAPTLRRWFSDEALCRNPWYVRYARARVSGASVERWSSWWRAFATFDIRDRLQLIRPRVTLIAGEFDRSTPPDEMRMHAEAIPGASYRLVPGGSHLTVLEQPAVVATLIREHLGVADLPGGGD